MVAVVRRAGRVLVIQRGPRASWQGTWSPPSGRIEPGESQEQAVVREVREELGLRVRPLAKVWECPTDDGAYRLHWWTVEVVAPDALALDPGEASDARWVDAAAFLRLAPTFAGDREFFARVLPLLP